VACPFLKQSFTQNHKDTPPSSHFHPQLSVIPLRRVVNRILDHLHEYASDDDDSENDYDPDSISWPDLDGVDDMYM
jgi:hypothetical protein